MSTLRNNPRETQMSYLTFHFKWTVSGSIMWHFIAGWSPISWKHCNYFEKYIWQIMSNKRLVGQLFDMCCQIGIRWCYLAWYVKYKSKHIWHDMSNKCSTLRTGPRGTQMSYLTFHVKETVRGSIIWHFMSNWNPISWKHPNAFETYLTVRVSKRPVGQWYLTYDVKLASDGVILHVMSTIYQKTVIIWHGMSNKWFTLRTYPGDIYPT